MRQGRNWRAGLAPGAGQPGFPAGLAAGEPALMQLDALSGTLAQTAPLPPDAIGHCAARIGPRRAP